jgi:nickel/cobalt exporter
MGELTLIRDLRSLVGPFSVQDRGDLYDHYLREVGPLNARGFRLTVDGRELELAVAEARWAVEEHPILTFRLESAIPQTGLLQLVDTNYVSSLGSSRLAFRHSDLMSSEGYVGPAEVDDLPFRPVWQLSDAEEQSTREIKVNYRPATTAGGQTPAVPPPDPGVEGSQDPAPAPSSAC